MKKAIFLLLFFYFGGGGPELFANDSKVELLEQLLKKAATQKSLEDRIHFFNQEFLGTPYESSPLGEGESSDYDRDPLWRLDQFDCTTFVETTLALGLASNSKDFEWRMNQIRYREGSPSFLSRNHFVGLDWLPNLVKRLKWGEDITKSFAQKTGVELRQAKAWVSRVGWLKKLSLDAIRTHWRMGLTEEDESVTPRLENLKTQNALSHFIDELETLPYLSIEELLKKDLLKMIPHATVLSIVRPNWNLAKDLGTHLNVSHQGWVLIENEEPLFYEASALKSDRKIIRIPLETYLKAQVSNKTIQGIHLFQPLLH